jgi:hypothetical protein
LTIADVARDDYLYLEKQSFVSELFIGAESASFAFVGKGACFDFDLPLNIVIGGGQALHVAIGSTSLAGQSSVVLSAYRTLVGPVA